MVYLFKLNYNISKIWQLSKQSSKISERILINESKIWFMAMDFYHCRCLKAQFFMVKVFEFF